MVLSVLEIAVISNVIVGLVDHACHNKGKGKKDHGRQGLTVSFTFCKQAAKCYWLMTIPLETSNVIDGEFHRSGKTDSRQGWCISACTLNLFDIF